VWIFGLEVEGDSHLVIKGLQKLLNGVMEDKISKNWWLSHGLSVLGGMVTSLASIVPKQTRRKENEVVLLHGQPRHHNEGKVSNLAQGTHCQAGWKSRSNRAAMLDLTAWREAVELARRDTWIQGRHHDASKEDKWPETVTIGTVEGQIPLHEGGPNPI
jgi:hypothetical protein